MLKPKVLVTGGTGLVGTDILKRLVQDGYEVLSISRRAPSMDSGKVEWIPADFSKDPRRILEDLPSVEYIVHAAAAVRTEKNEDTLAVFRKTNMEFTEALFLWARLKKVTAVIYISGFNILQRPLNSMIAENHPLAPLTPYALTKYWGELALAHHASPNFFRPVALRVSSPIALSFDLLHDTVVKKWIQLARKHQPLLVQGKGNRRQDFVYTTDIAQAVVKAIENPAARGVYHIASGTTISMLELAELIANNWGTEIILQGEDINEEECWNISISRARQELGYEPQ